MKERRVFTGIVEQTGVISRTQKTPGGRRLAVEAGDLAREASPGASVCVSGVCLTVADRRDDVVEFDVIRETLDRSTLGAKRVGQAVNLERSLRVGDPLDGHFVQGHVDATARTESVRETGEEYVLSFEAPSDLVPLLIPKGSVAIDGVSLTIATVDATSFSVALIPTTLERTTLSTLRAGDTVNIESDLIVRTIVHQVARMGPRDGLTLEHLRQSGFA